MIITNDNLIETKKEYNIKKFLKSKLSPKLYFKYFYDEPRYLTEIYHNFKIINKEYFDLT